MAVRTRLRWERTWHNGDTSFAGNLTKAWFAAAGCTAQLFEPIVPRGEQGETLRGLNWNEPVLDEQAMVATMGGVIVRDPATGMHGAGITLTKALRPTLELLTTGRTLADGDGERRVGVI